MEIFGLPLHALVVHAAVVLGPVSALAGIAYAAVPKWRDWLRWPLVAVATAAFLSIWVSYLSGEQVEEANDYSGPLAPLLEEHEEAAEGLRIAATVFAVITWAAAWWHTRTGTLRIVLLAGVGVSAIATAVWTVMTGHAGAEIGWYGVKS